MIEVLLGISIFCGGFIVGKIINNGVIIEIKTKGNYSESVEYNESVVDELDPEIRDYYMQNNGLNKF